MLEIFKFGDDLINTDASEEQLHAIVKHLENKHGEDGFNIYDLIYIFQKRNIKYDFVHINKNIKW